MRVLITNGYIVYYFNVVAFKIEIYDIRYSNLLTHLKLPFQVTTVKQDKAASLMPSFIFHKTHILYKTISYLQVNEVFV